MKLHILKITQLLYLTVIIFCLSVVSLFGQNTEDISSISLKKVKNEGSISLSQLTGQPVLVNFWAPWCVPCLAEFPELEKLQAKYSDQLTLIAVTSENSLKKIQKFLAKAPVTFPIFIDTDATLHEAIPVTGMPFTILLDKNGHIHQTFIGFNKQDKLDHIEEELKKLLKTQ